MVRQHLAAGIRSSWPPYALRPARRADRRGAGSAASAGRGGAPGRHGRHRRPSHRPARSRRIPARFPVAVAFVREIHHAPGCRRLCADSARRWRRARAADRAADRGPTLLITGDADAVNPPSVAQALADRIRRCHDSRPRIAAAIGRPSKPRRMQQPPIARLLPPRRARGTASGADSNASPIREDRHGRRDLERREARAASLFTNVRILDATGDYPYTGEVLVQGNRIKQITRGSSRFA